MQSAYASPSALSCEGDGRFGSLEEEGEEDPQAAIASPQRAAGNAAVRYRDLLFLVAMRWVLRGGG
jgi:hypothetical protein